MSLETHVTLEREGESGYAYDIQVRVEGSEDFDGITVEAIQFYDSRRDRWRCIEVSEYEWERIVEALEQRFEDQRSDDAWERYCDARETREYFLDQETYHYP